MVEIATRADAVAVEIFVLGRMVPQNGGEVPRIALGMGCRSGIESDFHNLRSKIWSMWQNILSSLKIKQVPL